MRQSRVVGMVRSPPWSSLTCHLPPDAAVTVPCFVPAYSSTAMRCPGVAGSIASFWSSLLQCRAKLVSIGGESPLGPGLGSTPARTSAAMISMRVRWRGIVRACVSGRVHVAPSKCCTVRWCNHWVMKRRLVVADLLWCRRRRQRTSVYRACCAGLSSGLHPGTCQADLSSARVTI